MTSVRAETYVVKVRAKGAASWKFLGSDQMLTRFRHLAKQMTWEIARDTALDVEKDDPAYEVEVRLFWRGDEG